MLPVTEWAPSEADIIWQKNLLRALKAEAVWAIPYNGSAFAINQTNKTFYLQIGDPIDDTNRRIVAVFEILGYTNITSPEAINRLHAFF